MAQTTLISDPQVRAKRQIDNRWKLLRFLREEIWSSQDVLQQVLGFKSRQATHKVLTSYASIGLLRAHTFQALGGNITLWGITSHGQGMAFKIGEEIPYPAYFEPSKVAEVTIRHSLDLQKLRIKAEQHGWCQWINGDRTKAIDGGTRRPDAIAIDPLGRKVAVECERTLKAQKRYDSLLLSYLKAIKAGEVNVVAWVSPTVDLSIRLQTIITGISTLRINGKRVAIDPATHHANLRFIDYEKWPAIDSNANSFSLAR